LLSCQKKARASGLSFGATTPAVSPGIAGRHAREKAAAGRRLEEALVALVDDHRAGVLAIADVVQSHEFLQAPGAELLLEAGAQVRDKVSGRGVAVDVVDIDFTAVFSFQRRAEAERPVTPRQFAIERPVRHAGNAIAGGDLGRGAASAAAKRLGILRAQPRIGQARTGAVGPCAVERELGTVPAGFRGILEHRTAAGVRQHDDLVFGVNVEGRQIGADMRAHESLDAGFIVVAAGGLQVEVESGRGRGAGTIGQFTQRRSLEALAIGGVEYSGPQI